MLLLLLFRTAAAVPAAAAAALLFIGWPGERCACWTEILEAIFPGVTSGTSDRLTLSTVPFTGAGRGCLATGLAVANDAAFLPGVTAGGRTIAFCDEEATEVEVPALAEIEGATLPGASAGVFFFFK
jgi:hypothetical protein